MKHGSCSSDRVSLNHCACGVAPMSSLPFRQAKCILPSTALRVHPTASLTFCLPLSALSPAPSPCRLEQEMELVDEKRVIVFVNTQRQCDNVHRWGAA